MMRRDEKEQMVSDRKLRLATPERDWTRGWTHAPVPEEGTRICAEGRFVGEQILVGPRPRTLPGTRDTRRGFAIVQAFEPSRRGRASSGVARRASSWWTWSSSARSDSGKGEGERARSSASDSEVFMVVRGWVPENWEGDDASKGARTVISGVVKASEVPSMFVPRNQPAKNTWFYFDTNAMGETLGLPEGTPLVEAVQSDNADASAGVRRVGHVVSGGGASQFPLTKDVAELLTFKVTTQDHLNYAMTWYTLSAITATMAYRAVTARKRLRLKK